NERCSTPSTSQPLQSLTTSKTPVSASTKHESSVLPRQTLPAETRITSTSKQQAREDLSSPECSFHSSNELTLRNGTHDFNIEEEGTILTCRYETRSKTKSA